MVNASTVQIAVLRGRDEECRTIRGLLDAHAGGALLMLGDPGSGRTALLSYAHRHARDRTVLAGAGLAEEAALPYAGLQRLLDPLLDRTSLLPHRQRRVLLDAVTGDGCPADQRLALSMAVLGLLAGAARERPLLCTMDDVDLGDRPTAEVLAFVARRLRHVPASVILSGGVDAATGGIPTVRLSALDDQHSRAVLTDHLPDDLPEPVATALGTVAGGNPQALVDLANSLTPAQRRGDEPLPAAPPPDGVLGRHYRARLDRLPVETRRLLLLAAIDDDLDASTLLRSARDAGPGIEALAPAEIAGLVRVEARTVTFPQPMARAMVVATAPLADRRWAHLLLADLLTGLPDSGPRHRLRLALHLAAAAEGSDPELASELATAAGAEGDQEPMTSDAPIDHRTAAAALHHAADLSADPARAAARRLAAARHAWAAGEPCRARLLAQDAIRDAADPPLVGRADLLRGEMELRGGQLPAALTALLAAADRLAGTDRSLALTALVRAGEAVCFAGDQFRYAEVERRAGDLPRPGDPPGTELMTAYLTGVAATLRGDHDRAGPALRRAVVLGGQVTGPALTPSALAWAASAGLLVAVDGVAHRLADRAVELARTRGELSALPRALELRAVAEYWMGLPDVAAASCRDGLRIARDTGQRNSAAAHLGMLAVLAAIRGDRAASLRRIQEIGDGIGTHSRPRALAQWALAVLDLVDGRHADAAARLAALAQPGTGRGQVLVHVMATPYLVEAAAQVGHRPAAHAALTVFDRWAAGTASPARRAIAARCRALLAPRGSVEAVDAFGTALRLHPATGGAFERARTELLFGRELRRRRRPRDAREHLHSARETFTCLGLARWAEQAAAELRAAGESVGGPDLPVARALTGQQLRIAQLVAEGATNKEIAARMFLSTRTIDHHLRNIFNRLGVRSRIELARALA
ncbi:LuxR C-terminal-related transcriptional regulator [Plantactinospora sp. GCM10030261]|uniref:helix-turn-helix transcriptional regulator n=1 Tax=Plantactinospora sp. GCM10030261 TaxID=3273420 RepID=UPI00361C5B83